MKLTLFYFLFLIYEEIIYKLLTQRSFSASMISLTLYCLFVAATLSLLNNLFSNKIKKIILPSFLFIISALYATFIIVKRFYDITLSFSSLKLYDQVAGKDFIGTTIQVLYQNWYLLLLIFLPFIISFFILKITKIKKYNKSKTILLNIGCSLICFLLFIFSIKIDIGNKELSDLYFKYREEDRNCEHFGALPAFLIDARKQISGFEETIEIEDDSQETQLDIVDVVLYDRQVTDLKFTDLAKNETNNLYRDMDTYFAKENSTFKNQYTGLFKDKNLIYIMAETFNGYAVDEKLTPTLYKLIHEGFYFENFYSPTNLSTIGGEFSLLTGLYPTISELSNNWRTGNNYYPYGLGTLFKQQNYATYAYHNNTYTFQDRNIYLKSLGFDNYLGCGNGLENKNVACNIFPESDDEMIMGTINDYINDEKFMVYYATVSGHMGWGYYNGMSRKHWEKVEGDYSDTVHGFIASTIELETALSSLISQLEQANKLNDTVIVLAADHHPYGFGEGDNSRQLKYMEELANKELDPYFEIYRNNLIIYNPEINGQTITKVGNTIDVLPTVLNLFGIPFDSRIIIGKDLLAKGEGLVLFANGHWLSDSGKYNAYNATFIPNQNPSYSNEETYINKMNKLAKNRRLMSKNIMAYDYYRHIFER